MKMKSGKQRTGYLSGVDEHAAPFKGGRSKANAKPGGRAKRSKTVSVGATQKNAGHGY
jgi:hypothetical protein